MYTILFYDVVDDYVEKRGAFRTQHLELAGKRTSVVNWYSPELLPSPLTARCCYSVASRRMLLWRSRKQTRM
jgi:hypothetical protein